MDICNSKNCLGMSRSVYPSYTMYIYIYTVYCMTAKYSNKHGSRGCLLSRFISWFDVTKDMWPVRYYVTVLILGWNYSLDPSIPRTFTMKFNFESKSTCKQRCFCFQKPTKYFWFTLILYIFLCLDWKYTNFLGDLINGTANTKNTGEQQCCRFSWCIG